MYDYIPRRAVETSTWYILKVRLEQKHVCVRALLTNWEGENGVKLN